MRVACSVQRSPSARTHPDARSDLRSGRRPLKAPIIDSPHAYRFGEGQLASVSSIGRRMFRALARFSIAVLIGVGATLGWQSYGDAAKEMLVARAPTLAWVLSVSTTKSPVVAATSTDPMQQLAPLVFNLDFVRRSVEQMSRSACTCRACGVPARYPGSAGRMSRSRTTT